jgi:hypothetical protein
VLQSGWQLVYVNDKSTAYASYLNAAAPVISAVFDVVAIFI